MLNYMEWNLMGTKITMKPGILPHKFACQGRRDPGSVQRPANILMVKRRRKVLVEESLQAYHSVLEEERQEEHESTDEPMEIVELGINDVLEEDVDMHDVLQVDVPMHDVPEAIAPLLESNVVIQPIETFYCDKACQTISSMTSSSNKGSQTFKRMKPKYRSKEVQCSVKVVDRCVSPSRYGMKDASTTTEGDKLKVDDSDTDDVESIPMDSDAASSYKPVPQ